MTKNRILMLSVLIMSMLVFVAGCGSNDHMQQQTEQPAQSGQMAMPMGDPMPLMKDMDKALQDLTKQVKDGQTMDAQTTVGQLASTCDKVTPHLSDSSLKDRMHKAAYDLKDTINSGKIDPTVIEGKVKTMQEVMQLANANLQVGMHTH